MKIILATDALRPPLTGIGRYTLELARRLPAQSPDISIRYFCLGRWISLPSAVDLDELEDSRSPRSFVLRSRSFLAQRRWAVNLYRHLSPVLYWWTLRKFQDHLYHSPNYFLPPFGGKSIATIHDISTFRDPSWHPPARVALMEAELPRTLTRATHLITDSNAVRQEIIDYFGWPAERITAIPLGVDGIFHPRKSNELSSCLHHYGLTPGFYCLCVATIEPRKNIGRLIDAYVALSPTLRQRYPLVLVGERGWNSDDVHARIADEQRRGHLLYLDYVPQSDLPLILAGARLFVFPSLYEGFGLPLVEAMASGIPVVTSNIPTSSELTSGVSLQVDPYDTNALTMALQRGLEDETWRLQAAELGLQRARSYTWDLCVKRTVRLYQNLYSCS
ncbi:MAG: glycosyltransferase family 4 protein [Thermochromatium sp.]